MARSDGGRPSGEVTSLGPRRIGPYRLERELGRGGMGTVYLAVRDDGARPTEVAIKLPHRGLALAVARLGDERRILAALEHPGIVRMLGGGSTDEGLPYLVMERLAGATITAWADARELGVRARVELFCRVCEAVGYLHARRVIHRDLKPDNILVTDDGTPKLLDFGIAELLEAGGDREAATGAELVLFTPAYAAPEQVLGEPVSAAADVYALGAVLYELLAGVPAHRLEGGGLSALCAMLETDPPPPSLVARPDRRRAIAGDLDRIILKALQKEPGQRHASVEQLAGELRRHLEDRSAPARTGMRTCRIGQRSGTLKRATGGVHYLGDSDLRRVRERGERGSHHSDRQRGPRWTTFHGDIVMFKVGNHGIFSRRGSIYSFIVAGLLLLGSACGVEQTDEQTDSQTELELEPEPDPASTPEGAPEVDPRDVTQEASGGGTCSIDYYCPTNGYESTGYKSGSPSIAQAYAACDAACNVTCTSSGLICD